MEDVLTVSYYLLLNVVLIMTTHTTIILLLVESLRVKMKVFLVKVLIVWAGLRATWTGALELKGPSVTVILYYFCLDKMV